MALTNPPPLKLPALKDDALRGYLTQLNTFCYLLWDQVGGRGITPITAGGTGSDTAAGARFNLGLEIDSDILAYDAGLASIAGLTTAANKLIYTTAFDVYAVADFTAYGRSLVAVADEAAFKALTNLEIDVDIQAYSLNLDEADAFFGATDISASEAETLTDGSDAQALHTHEFYQRYSLVIA